MIARYQQDEVLIQYYMLLEIPSQFRWQTLND